MGNRVIPVLLVKKQGLYKGTKFRKLKYIGDPINAIRIFSEKEVDELILLDIEATNEKRSPNFDFIQRVAEECYMPFAVGGGISSIESIHKVIKSGAEKVIINSAAVAKPNFIKDASNHFGSSSIVVSIDYKKNWRGNHIVYSHNGTKKSKYSLIDFSELMEEMGAGELFINSIDRDGTCLGLDIKTLNIINKKLSIPIIGCGGIGTTEHIYQAFEQTEIDAIAAGSFFVFKGENRSVLISYYH